MSKRRGTILGVALFYLLACGLTLLFAQAPKTWQWGEVNVRLILCGWGPLLSGLVCYRLLRTDNVRGITLAGKRPVVALSIVLVALLLPLLTAGDASLGSVISLVATHFIYSFGEEFGWRHYLQNATNDLNDWLQGGVIGILWFFWHFTFLDDPIQSITGGSLSPVVGVPLLILILSGLSIFFGKLVTRTGSILLPTVAHYAPKSGSMLTLAVALAALIAVLIFWQRLERTPATKAAQAPKAKSDAPPS